MPLSKTINEYKIAWLKAALGATNYTSIQGLEFDFYSKNSGLTPVARFSVSDHKRAFYILQTSASAKTSLSDLERVFWNSKGALSTQDYDKQAQTYYSTYPFVGGAVLAGYSNSYLGVYS